MLPENVFQHVRRLFTENERLRVTPCRLLSCSSGVAGNNGSEGAPFVEAHFWRIDDCVSTPLCGNHHVYRDSGSFGAGQCLWLNGPDGHRQAISISSCVTEVCLEYFCKCRSLQCVIFYTKNLKRLCAEAFCETSIESLCIPDSVVELCERCFYHCERLRCVTFGVSSKLERIGSQAFRETSIESLCIPDSVVELRNECFYRCERLRCVTFGASSKLECIGARGFDVLHLVHHQSLSVLALGHSVRRILSPCVFQTVLLNCAMSAFVSASGFDVLHLEYHQTLSVLVLGHSIRRVLSPCVFQTVLLSCVMSVFGAVIGFDV